MMAKNTNTAHTITLDRFSNAFVGCISNHTIKLQQIVSCSFKVLFVYSYNWRSVQLSHAQTPSGNQRAISASALATASDPWQMFLPTSMLCVDKAIM